MIEHDTVRLLRECDAGIKMGISSITDVLGRVHHGELHSKLVKCRDEHKELEREVSSLLGKYHDREKHASGIATAMAKMKTGFMLQMKPGDATVADLMTDGCNMGVKSLSRYLNEYKAASEVSKDIAKRLIHLEATLASDIRGFL